MSRKFLIPTLKDFVRNPRDFQYAYIDPNNWERVKDSFSKPPDELRAEVEFFGMKVCVDDSIPINEIHCKSIRFNPDKNEFELQTIKIVNLACPHEPTDIHDAFHGGSFPYDSPCRYCGELLHCCGEPVGWFEKYRDEDAH